MYFWVELKKLDEWLYFVFDHQQFTWQPYSSLRLWKTLLGCLESSKSLAVTALDVAVSGTKERLRLCKISFFMGDWLKSIQQSIYNEILIYL